MCRLRRLKSYLYQDFFLLAEVAVGKWDLYSFSIVLTMPSSIRTGSGVAGGVRISSAPG